MKTLIALLTSLFLITTARAGTFSVTPWTNDASSGIVAVETLWAYHFGSTATATVNGFAVPGLTGPTVSNADLDLTGTQNTSLNDTNNLTALGGSGSAVIANDFVFNGNPAIVKLNRLTPGTHYTVSLLSVGWRAAESRVQTFSSGNDSSDITQQAYGEDNGIRVDYSFTATASTQTITITPKGAGTWHFYAIALKSTTLFVTNESESGPGSLRQAVANAALLPGPDTIRFSPSVVNVVSSSEILIDSEVTIDGDNGTQSVTLSGGNLHRVFRNQEKVVLRNMEIAFGQTSDQGGGIFNNGGNLTLENVTLNQCEVTSDTARGGAIYNGGSATLTLTDCTITGCKSKDHGGAIFNNGGTVTIESSAILGNTATADDGGGLYNFGGAATIKNSTFTNNHAGDAGGAILANSSATTTLTHVTIAGNSAGFGGGIRLGSGTLTLENTIVAGNSATTSAPDILNNGTITQQGFNLVRDKAGSGLTAGGLIGTAGAPVEALLAPLGHYGGPTQTMPPLPGSPSIDAGGTLDPGGTDQRGASRTVDGNADNTATADIGAVEFVPAIVTNNADSDSGSLRDAIALPFASTITFAQSLSGKTITLTAGQLTIDKSLTIDASNITGGITIDADQKSGIFIITRGNTVTLSSLTLSNGVAFEGGGIFNLGTLTLNNSTLSGNSAEKEGGGISNFGTLTLNNSTLSGNSAQNEGGGIYNRGTLTLNNSTLSGNSSDLDGGGIYNHGTLTLNNSTLSGNNAAESGGGIDNQGTLTLNNSTLSGNSSKDGGGIYNFKNDFLTLTVTLNNSIVGGNTATFTGPDIENTSFPGTIALQGVNFIGNTAGAGTIPDTGGSYLTGAPLLSPLGWYGGATQTIHPLAGSPAINPDGGAISATGTDQRGFSRLQGATVDIGAVEVGTEILVTTLVDEDNASPSTGLSLREAVAAASQGALITFDPAVFTAGTPTITLAHGQITIPETLVIDATNIPGGITIDAAQGSRIFEITPGNTVTLSSLTLSKGVDSVSGGIYNEGTLTLNNSTLSGNSSEYGGGIYNDGTLTLNNSTLSGNSSFDGGGIYNEGTLTLNNSTLSGNSADFGGGGGGIHNRAGGTFSTISVTLNQSTLSGNNAERGGGIYNGNNGTLTLTLNNSIVGGNTATSNGPDINNTDLPGAIALQGLNFIGDAEDSSLNANGTTLIVADPKLSPLGDYGGPTRTMPPLPGSPAINAATTSTATSDQRDFPIVSTPDIGAAEYQGNADLARFWTLDWDGDGNPYGIEYALGTDPLVSDPAHARNPVLMGDENGKPLFTFGRNSSAAPGTVWRVTRSTNLVSFTEIYRYNGTTSTPAANVSFNSISVTDLNPPPGKAFYRFEALSPP